MASTRLPIPVVRVSDSFWANVAWIENFAAPDDSLARAELTPVSEVWIVATRVEALAWVEIVAVDFKVTIEPDRLQVLGRGGDAARAISRGQAVIWVVEPSTRLKPLNTAFFTIVVI